MTTQKATQEIIEAWAAYKNDMRPETRNEFLRCFDKNIGSLQPQIPEGYALVPIEVTDEMAEACRTQIGIEFGQDDKGTLGYYKRIINRAISSAPKGEGR